MSFDINIPDHALALIDALESAGYETWVVGGVVRDAIMHRPATDVDLATSALWQDVRTVCDEAGFKSYETGIKHGTITVIVKDGQPIEVTTFRSDGSYSDSRHPDSVRFVSSIEEDLSRRDFTINAMAYHPARGLLDPFDGLKDMEHKTIRSVGCAEKRFSEDALRILRACRFASQLGFEITAEDYDAMLRCKHKLAGISTERITHELDALLLGDYVHDALMAYTGVLSYVLPELVAMDGCEQVTKWHIYDVLEHTAYTVQFSPKDRLARWAALAHDMGKPASAFFTPDGVEHFYGHAKLSAKIASGMFRRLLMSQTFRNDLELLVLRHDDLIEPTPRAMRRVLAKFDGRADMVRTLLALKRADTLAHSQESASYISVIDQLEVVLEEVLNAGSAFSLKDLKINGNDILALGAAEGPAIGAKLRAALDAVIDGSVANERKPLLDFVSSLDAR